MIRSPALRAVVCGIPLVLASTLAALYLHPPALFRVGASYSAKIVCSNVFLAGRDPAEVLANDVQAPGHPLLKLIRVTVNRDRQEVRSGMLGFIGGGLAIHRAGTGCAAVPDGDVAQAASHRFTPEPVPLPPADLPWPAGQQAESLPAVTRVLADETLAGPGWRALAVIHRGKLVGERYAPGFNQDTPLLGWSMTKTVTAVLVGIQVGAGRTALTQQGFWANEKDDPRNAVRLADLLAMSSGLRFNEGYGSVSDVTRMLYLEPDMPAFVRTLPLDHPPGSVWDYSSGTTVLLSQLWQQAAGSGALSLPQRALFAPLGMRSATLEADARGTHVGSSYLYASARDWGRFGQFLLQEGVWAGKRLLPEGYVRMMATSAPASRGEYGLGQVWRRGAQGDTPDGQDPDAPYQLPADTYWMSGHDGQSIAIVPSQQLVVVRLGLTPARLNYKPQALLKKLITAFEPATISSH